MPAEPPNPKESIYDLSTHDAWEAVTPHILSLALGNTLGNPTAIMMSIGAAMRGFDDTNRVLARIEKKINVIQKGPLLAGKRTFEQAKLASNDNTRKQLLHEARSKCTDAAHVLEDEPKLEAMLYAAMAFSGLDELKLAQQEYQDTYKEALSLNGRIFQDIEKDRKKSKYTIWVSYIPAAMLLTGGVNDYLEKSAAKKGLRLYENETFIQSLETVIGQWDTTLSPTNKIFGNIKKVKIAKATLDLRDAKSHLDSPTNPIFHNTILECEHKYRRSVFYDVLSNTFFDTHTRKPITR